MTLFVFLAVLGSAVLHAGWNAAIKLGTNKLTAMLILTIVQGGAGLCIALTRPIPGAEVIPWLLASGAFHAGYKLCLALAYEQGDLSRVYPIARGAAPLLVLAVSPLLLPERLSIPEIAGIVVLGLGILSMARGIRANDETLALLPFALGSAAMTAGYSVVDGLGARASGDAVAYVGWLFTLDALIFTPICMWMRGRAVVRAPMQAWALGSCAAAASYGAYAVAVWAMTQAPIQLVAALRETSILFAVLIGWLLLGERLGWPKLRAAGLILVGVALTRI